LCGEQDIEEAAGFVEDVGSADEAAALQAGVGTGHEAFDGGIGGGIGGRALRAGGGIVAAGEETLCAAGEVVGGGAGIAGEEVEMAADKQVHGGTAGGGEAVVEAECAGEVGVGGEARGLSEEDFARHGAGGGGGAAAAAEHVEQKIHAILVLMRSAALRESLPFLTEHDIGLWEKQRPVPPLGRATSQRSRQYQHREKEGVS
jgi:hypothetical protein